MRCLLTGATGFIGSWMAERLVNSGMSVRCLVRKDAGALAELPLEIVPGSLFEPDALRAALAGVDCVIHFAGITRALRKSDYYRLNVQGSEALLAAVIDAAPNLRKFVHISSQAAAGPARNGTPLTEDDKPHPITDYGKSKLASEELLRRFMDRIPIVILRPPVVYGPRDRSGLSLFKSAARGWRLSISGCDPCFAPIYVEDLVEGVHLALLSEAAAGKTYFLSGDEAVRASELTALLSELAGASGRELRLPYSLAWLAVHALELRARLNSSPNRLNHAKLREIAEPYWLASNARAKAELAFRPRCPLEQSLRATLEWYCAAGWL